MISKSSNCEAIRLKLLPISDRIKFKFTQFVENFFFSTSQRKVCSESLFIAFLWRHVFPFSGFALGSISPMNAGFMQSSGDRQSVDFESFRNRIFRLSRNISPSNFIYGKDLSISRSIDKFIESGIHSPLAHTNAEIIGVDIKKSRNLNNLFPGLMKCDSIVDKSFRKFSGFIYNAHTDSNYYWANGLAMHNCFAEPVFQDE